MYCEIVYFIEENNCEKRHADLKPRGYNCFWIDPGVYLLLQFEYLGVLVAYSKPQMDVSWPGHCSNGTLAQHPE